MDTEVGTHSDDGIPSDLDGRGEEREDGVLSRERVDDWSEGVREGGDDNGAGEIFKEKGSVGDLVGMETLDGDFGVGRMVWIIPEGRGVDGIEIGEGTIEVETFPGEGEVEGIETNGTEG